MCMHSLVSFRKYLGLQKAILLWDGIIRNDTDRLSVDTKAHHHLPNDGRSRAQTIRHCRV